MTAEHDGEDPRQKYKQLPPQVRVEDTVTSQETWPARDPENGRNTDRDFEIRNAGS